MSPRTRMTSVVHSGHAGETLRRRRRAERLLAHEEDERARLARRLERGAAHTLVAALLQLAPLERDAVSEDAREGLTALRAALSELVIELRDVGLALHPPLLDELGLTVALDALAEAAGEDLLRPVVASVALELDALPPHVALAAYRICEDLLEATAGPLQLRLRLRAPDRLQLVAAAGEGRVPGRVVDAGRLALARARVELAGGAFTVADRRGGGVLVHADLPLPR